MMNFCHPYFLLNFNRMLLRSLVVSAIATVGLLSGLTFNTSRSDNAVLFSAAAYAQDVNDTQVSNYAAAVLKAEPVRQQAYDEIKNIIGSSNIPPIVCNKPESLDSLPGNARSIAVDYCSQYKQIVESNGLTIGRFNEITVNMQNNSNLKSRIQAEMLRIQSSSN